MTTSIKPVARLLAETILDLAHSNGGATISAGTGLQAPQTAGYFVSLGEPHTRVIDLVESGGDEIQAFIQSRMSILLETDVYIGIWSDGYVIYLDITEHVTDKAAAIRLGHERQQIAVWDIANQTEIFMQDSPLFVSGRPQTYSA